MVHFGADGLYTVEQHSSSGGSLRPGTPAAGMSRHPRQSLAPPADAVPVLPTGGKAKVKPLWNAPMKVTLLALVACFFLLSQETEARYLIKWYHDPTSPRTGRWVFMWYDKWGGENYQCQPGGSVCHLWDWVAVYPLNISEQDPNPEANTTDFWYGLTRSEAQKLGVELPQSPPASAVLSIEEHTAYPPELPRP